MSDTNINIGKMKGNLAKQSVSGNQNQVKVVHNNFNMDLTKENLQKLVGLDHEISKRSFDTGKDREEFNRLKNELNDLLKIMKESVH